MGGCEAIRMKGDSDLSLKVSERASLDKKNYSTISMPSDAALTLG
jgi:hypothetical protein